MSCAPDLPQSDGGLPFGLSSRERAAVILNFFPFARLTRCVGRAVFFAAGGGRDEAGETDGRKSSSHLPLAASQAGLAKRGQMAGIPDGPSLWQAAPVAGKAVQFSEGLLEIGGNCYFPRFYHRMITNLFYTVGT